MLMLAGCVTMNTDGRDGMSQSLVEEKFRDARAEMRGDVMGTEVERGEWWA